MVPRLWGGGRGRHLHISQKPSSQTPLGNKRQAHTPWVGDTVTQCWETGQRGGRVLVLRPHRVPSFNTFCCFAIGQPRPRLFAPCLISSEMSSLEDPPPDPCLEPSAAVAQGAPPSSNPCPEPDMTETPGAPPSSNPCPEPDMTETPGAPPSSNPCPEPDMTETPGAPPSSNPCPEPDMTETPGAPPSSNPCPEPDMTETPGAPPPSDASPVFSTADTQMTPPVLDGPQSTTAAGVPTGTAQADVLATRPKRRVRLAPIDLYRGLACTSMIIAHAQNLLVLAPQNFVDFLWYTGPANASGCPLPLLTVALLDVPARASGLNGAWPAAGEQRISVGQAATQSTVLNRVHPSQTGGRSGRRRSTTFPVVTCLAL